MKLNKLVICVLSGILLADAAFAQEAEEGERPVLLPALELSLDHTSRYMSEGNVGNPDPINTIGEMVPAGAANPVMYAKLIAFSFMVCNLFFPPCLVAIATMWREMGSAKWGGIRARVFRCGIAEPR